MAELTEPTPASTAASSCCAPEAQQTCCEPSEKATCCNTAATGGSCGCDAGLVDVEVVETHRVHEHAASAIIRARKPH